MGPLRILCCCLIKDTVVLVVMLGSHGPFPHPTLLPDKGHFGPSSDGMESRPSPHPTLSSNKGRLCPISDGRESGALSASDLAT